ncbi:MAG: MFS transporter [Steroidobacteraceae bacterium]
MWGSTALLWVTFFASLLVFYLLTSWLPIATKDNGFSISNAARIGAMVPLGGTVGAIVLAHLMDRTGSIRTLVASYVCGAIAVTTIGLQSVAQ